VFVRDDDPESAEALIADLEPGSTRLEGLILRSQLLVLLQRKHFCDSHGKPIGRDPNPRWVGELLHCNGARATAGPLWCAWVGAKSPSCQFSMGWKPSSPGHQCSRLSSMAAGKQHRQSAGGKGI
jgi:hypothetical protein